MDELLTPNEILPEWDRIITSTVKKYAENHNAIFTDWYHDMPIWIIREHSPATITPGIWGRVVQVAVVRSAPGRLAEVEVTPRWEHTEPDGRSIRVPEKLEYERLITAKLDETELYGMLDSAWKQAGTMIRNQQKKGRSASDMSDTLQIALSPHLHPHDESP